MYRYSTNLIFDYNDASLWQGELETQSVLIPPVSAPSTSSLVFMSGDDYADDSTTTGVLASNGDPLSGQIEVVGDIDWIAVTVDAGDFWRLELQSDSSASFHANFCLVTADGTVLAHSNYYYSDQTERVEYVFDTAGTYYVSVGANGSTTGGQYSANGTRFADDYSNDINTLGSLNVNSSVSGGIDYSGDSDWFAITLTADEIIRFVSDDSVALTLYDAGGNLVIGSGSELTAQIQASGQYFLGVTGYGGTTSYTVGNYRVTDDFAASAATGGTLAVGGSATGFINFVGDNDWLAIDLSAGTAVEFMTTGRGELAALRDASGQEVEFNFLRSDDLSGTINVAETGTYYLDVTGSTVGQFTVSAALIDDDYSNDINTTGVVSLDGATVSGSLERWSDTDWLAVTVGAGETWKFLLNNTTSAYVSFDFDLYATDGNRLFSGNYSDFESDRFIAYEFETAGTYYLSVEAYNVTDYTVSAYEIFGDASDDINTSGSIAVGSFVTGAIDFLFDEDWYAFNIDENESVSFSSDQSVFLNVYDSQGAYVSTVNTSEDGTILTDVVAGQYYLSVKRSGGSTNDYTVSAAIVADDYSANDLTTGMLTLGGSAIGNIDYSWDQDWFAVELQEGDVIAIESSGAAYLVAFMGPDGSSLGYTSDSGTYYIQVQQTGTHYASATSGVKGAYVLTASLQGDDFGNTAESAGEITLGDSMVVTNNFASDDDWVAINLTQDDIVRIALDSPDAGFQIYYEGQRIAFGDYSANGPSLQHIVEETGTYYIAISYSYSEVSSNFTLMASTIEDDYSNDFDTTGVIVPGGSTVYASTDYDGDSDWFAVDVEADTVVRFYLDSQHNIGLRDNNGDFLSLIQQFTTSDAQSYYGIFDEAGRYYFSLSDYDAGDYYIRAVIVDDDFTARTNTAGVLPTDGGMVTGRIDFTRDKDWFAVDLNLGDVLEVSIASGLSSTTLRVFDQNGDLINGTYGSQSGPLSFSSTETATYFVQVEGSYNSSHYNYDLSAIIISDDYAGDATTTGVATDDAPINGTLVGNSDQDWFVLTVSDGQIANLFATGASDTLRIVSASGEIIATGFEHDFNIYLDYQFDTAGTYFVSISNSNGSEGGYELTTLFDGPPNSNNPDATADITTQSTLANGLDRRVDFLGDVDWVRLEVDASQTLSFVQYWEFGFLPSEFEFSIFDEVGTLITPLAQQQSYGGPYYSHFFDEGGTYYLELDSSGAAVEQGYSLAANISDDDFGQSNSDAGIISLGETVMGSSEFENDLDTFVISLRAGQVIEIIAISEGGFYQRDYSFRTADGNIVSQDVGSEQYTVVTDGVYYIDIAYQSSVGSNYELVVNVISQDPIYGTAQGETINGTAFNDVIYGLEGNDYLRGEGGDDTLDGGFGADWLRGGAGADVLNGWAGTDWADYITSSAAVTVNLLANTATGGDAEGDTFLYIERVYGSRFDDHITGDNGVNYLRGWSGDDQLFGGAGNDYLQGGLGADALDGGAGTNDWAYYVSSAAGLTVDLGDAPNNTGEAIGDTYINIENVLGSRHDDMIYGDAAGNFLRGLQGDDSLFGGDGADFLRGDQGADALDGGAGFDWAYYASSSAAVTIDLGANTASGGDAAGDTFTSIERAFGSAFADSITGTSGANYLRGYFGNDTLNGGDGHDFLQGDAGADTLNGGDGSDWAYYASSTAISGITINLGDTSQNTGEAAGDVYNSIENIIGSRYDDIITGDAGDNYLRGFDGDDIISGGAGVDVLRGEAGADIFVFAPGGFEDFIVDWDDSEDMLDLTAFGYTSVEDALDTYVDMGDGNLLIAFSGNGGSVNVNISGTTIEELFDNVII